MSSRQPEKPLRNEPRCPMCRGPLSQVYRPFCSKRCADLDLGRWLNGRYAIASSVDDDEDGVASPATDYDPET